MKKTPNRRVEIVLDEIASIIVIKLCTTRSEAYKIAKKLEPAVANIVDTSAKNVKKYGRN